MKEQKCSRAGCPAAREALIVWRNPSIHRDGRTKTWGACQEHLGFLVDYLKQRNFYLETKSIDQEEQ
jgi:hypothetical protein